MENVNIKDFKENYCILIAADAGKCELFAAKELQKYLTKSIRVKPEIVQGSPVKPHFFSLGKTQAYLREEVSVQAEDLKNDGFLIFSAQGNIYFNAATPRGILYSIYEYLERFLGIRFLTADCEYIPKQKELPLPESVIVSEPDFAMRTYLAGDVFQEYANMEFVAKTRTKDVYTPIPDEMGGSVKIYGRNVSHNFHFYVPFEVYGNEHPEFYRFFYENETILPTIDLTNGITEDGKLDESMPVSVAKIVIEEMKKDIIKYPDVEIFMLTQEDGTHYYESERNSLHEKKFKRSGMLVRFCNVVVRELNRFAQKHLNGRVIRLMTFAYDYAMDAPVYEKEGKLYPLDDSVIADENLIIQFALFSDSAYDYFSDKQPAQIQKTMRDWSCIAKRFWFWAYDINFNRYLGYYDSFSNIQANIKGFKDFGIEYLCMQGPHDSCRNWQANIRGYAYRKLMWDSSLCAEKLMNEYIDLYYGPACGTVRKVMSIFHEHYQKLRASGKEVTFVTRGTHVDVATNPKEMLEECIEIIEKAENELLCSDFSKKRKDDLVMRLEGVKATPLMLLVDHFDVYYPDQPQIKKDFYQKFYECVKKGKLDTSGERWSMQQYLKEIGCPIS